MWKKLTIFTLTTNILLMAAGCVTAADKKTAAKEENFDTYEMLNLFGEVMERAKVSYVEEISDQKLIEAAINGMLSSLDPHSSFLDTKSFKYLNEQTQGKFGGLGIEVTMESGVVKVVSPVDDTPAFRAGIKKGDYIISIDGTPVIGMTLNEAVDKMRGKIGTKVKLTIRRATQKPFDVTLKREEIKIQSVKSDIKANDIAYIRISSFNDDADKNIKDKFAKMQKKTKKGIKGLIIDVRNNPGGLLDQAVAISDLFLDGGEIVSTRSRNEEDTLKYNATKGDITNGLPIVVLINDGSASASEILAGALQDHKRAVILGEKSFGKGSVQSVIPFRKYGAIRLTTARYYTPSGRSIQAKGIEPDIEVKPAKVELLNADGLTISEAELKNALKNDNIDNGKKKTQADKDSAKDEDLKKDYQLLRAVDTIKALSIYKQNTMGE
uniref:Peptidase S41 n=1 Tax=uncultured Alphaproteobacteria bacterium TaxID=91750 RepID=A0A6M4NMG7_9PROT|nr:peptidase S41 [uncultured Alphaproteobacteria bacterium]